MKNANPVSNIWRAGVLGLILLVSGGCGPAEPAVVAAPKTVKDWFPIAVGSIVIDMQIAVTGPEMQQGLMGRRDLLEGQGMLFVYPRATQLSFWMRNTPTPLDIGFFSSDGVLREIYPLHPFDERPVRSQRTDLTYALELLQGSYARLGLKPGDRLDLAGLKMGLVARGFEPGRFPGLTPVER